MDELTYYLAFVSFVAINLLGVGLVLLTVLTLYRVF